MDMTTILKCLTTSKNPIKLQPVQSKAITQFFQNKNTFISTFDFRKNGIMSPAQCINKLKTKGAIIQTIKKPAMDESGNLHNRVAHYKLMGWTTQ